MRRPPGAAALCIVLGWSCAASAATPHPTLATNRAWELFSAPDSDDDRRKILARAANLLDGLTVDLGGVPLTSERLRDVATAPASEPLLRAAREILRRPVDLDDLLYFLDDLALARARGLEMKQVVLPPSRLRSAGVLLHPNDVFARARPRIYGEVTSSLALSAPSSQQDLRPAKNGSVVGPRWAARYRQPTSEAKRLLALAKLNPDFAKRIRSLRDQLRDQGAWVHVESTVRRRERGFLIYGCYWLSKAKSARQVRHRIRRLNQLERRWGLRIPIRWRHPRGWRATVHAAKRLAETYSVDYATKGGAKKSDHYDGAAVDLWAVDLPRKLTLRAPDGQTQTFDLSDPAHPRDLSLAKELIDWIEAHFSMKKLRRDYPHWSDASES